MKVTKGSVNTVDGFTAVSKYVGIKIQKNDLLVIYSDAWANAAGVFTQNSVKGAPLIVSIDHLKDGKAQAIVVNSGISNVATGSAGIDDAKKMCKLVAGELNIKAEDVLVSSTGLIGKRLPMDKISEGLKDIKSGLTKNTAKIGEAILTTDLIPKEIFVKGDGFSIGAIAKGSGMVHPNMATMLCFITTDAEISSKDLSKYLKNAVSKSFNMISVDQDTSTSDSVIIMANGKAGKVDAEKFISALEFVCVTLAKKIAADGEGATKLIEVLVKNCVSEKDGKLIAKGIISSNLVKSAFFGNDVNWGRIICAMGNSGGKFNQDKIDISINGEKIVKKGVEVNYNKENAIKALKKKEVKVTIDLNGGDFNATAWGCDLSYDYIKINAEYHT